MEYSSSLPNVDHSLTIAFNILQRAARENGFAIHDVP